MDIGNEKGILMGDLKCCSCCSILQHWGILSRSLVSLLVTLGNRDRRQEQDSIEEERREKKKNTDSDSRMRYREHHRRNQGVSQLTGKRPHCRIMEVSWSD